MLEIPTLYDLKKEGKLHKRLVWRLRMLAFVVIVISGIISFDIVMRDLPWLGVLGFSSFGFILGFFLFKHMNKITWDEEKEVVSIGRFDRTSFIIIGIYVLYRLGMSIFLKEYYQSAIAISGFSLSAIWGGMLGRLIGTVYIIKRIHKNLQGLSL